VTRRFNRTTAAAALALFATTSVLAACGSDDARGSATTAAASDGSAPVASYVVVSDAAVATGYTNLIAKMTELSAAAASVDKAALDEVEALWFGFEATVKDKEPDSYLASEESLDAFNTAAEGKDAAAMTAATTKMSTTAAAYLATHPG
jgi:hypothetical protein